MRSARLPPQSCRRFSGSISPSLAVEGDVRGESPAASSCQAKAMACSPRTRDEADSNRRSFRRGSRPPACSVPGRNRRAAGKRRKRLSKCRAWRSGALTGAGRGTSSAERSGAGHRWAVSPPHDVIRIKRFAASRPRKAPVRRDCQLLLFPAGWIGGGARVIFRKKKGGVDLSAVRRSFQPLDSTTETRVCRCNS